MLRVNASGEAIDIDLAAVGEMIPGQIVVMCGPLTGLRVFEPPCDVSLGSPLAWGASAEDTLELIAGAVSIDAVVPAQEVDAAGLVGGVYAFYRSACDGCVIGPHPAGDLEAPTSWAPMSVASPSLKCRPPAVNAMGCGVPFTATPVCGGGGK